MALNQETIDARLRKVMPEMPLDKILEDHNTNEEWGRITRLIDEFVVKHGGKKS